MSSAPAPRAPPARPLPPRRTGAPPILTAIVITSVLVGVIGVPFTLWWWRIADKWADAEHRRFKTPVDDRERITVADPGEHAAGHTAGHGAAR